MVPAKQGVVCDAQADSVGAGQAEGGLSTVSPRLRLQGLARLRGQQPALGISGVGRHLPGSQAGLAPICLQCCKDLQSSGHRFLKIIEKSVRALICQELSLQVCPALTLFPTGATFLTLEYKYW